MNIKEQLRRQLDFIETSCRTYDAGNHEEAVRIAVALRVLFHQTRKSDAIINQLFLRDSIRLLSTFREFKRKEGVIAATFGGLVSHRGVTPELNRAKHQMMLSIDGWWEQVVHVFNGEYSRKNVVLAAANEDGGAHLAPNPKPKIRGLRVGVGRLTTKTPDGTTTVYDLDNTHFPLIRQFGYEVLNSPELIPASKMAERPFLLEASVE